MISTVRYPYEGHVVLVTGGGTGIGRAIARAFLEQGATVAVCGRSEQSLQETTAGFPEARTHLTVLDVTDADGVKALIAEVTARFGRLDTVIHSAGLSVPSQIDDFDMADWVRMRTVNLDALIAIASASVSALRESKGSLLAISSIAGLGGDWGQFAYNATKGGVNSLVQSLALDLGRDGVRVNAIAPGFTATAQTQERLDNPSFSAHLLDRLALDRAGTVEDVARAALFLSSDDASYITGVILPIDGGTTASIGTPRPLAHA